MHQYHLVKVILLTTALFLSGLISLSAHASVLKSDTSWKIKIVTLSDGLPPYCSMQNHYSKANVSLILAQDMENNVSLAIDFSEDIFEQDRQYAINFIIPNKLNRKIISDAINKHILVSQIGQDTKFLYSLGHGKQLRINMDGANLQFALSGTLKSLEKLSQCVTNLEKDIKHAKSTPQTLPTTTVQQSDTKLETMLKTSLNITDMDISHRKQGIYSWQKNNLYGNAQIFTWPKGKSFSEMIKYYTQKTKNRCTTNFASHTGQQTSLSGGNVYAVGNIACIGENTNNAAALFFHGINEKFIVISYEGSAPQLSDALALRNKISEHFLGRAAKQSMN